MTSTSCFNPILPAGKHSSLYWQQPLGASCPLTLAELVKSAKQPVLLITEDSLSAKELFDTISFFLDDKNNIIPKFIFPDWETLPYDHFSPHQDIISDRLRALAEIPLLENGLIITSINTLMQRLPPTHYIQQYSFIFKIGDTLPIEILQAQLIKCHYHSVSQVMEHGEFAVRGGIIDIFPMGSDNPIRIELFDKEIESIRWFDAETQLTTEKVDSIHLLPASEYPMSEQGITHFRKAWRSTFQGNPLHSPLYEDVSEGFSSPGIEYYLPLFFEETASLFDYCRKETLIVISAQCHTRAEEFWKEIDDRYNERNFDITRPLLAPQELYLTVNLLFEALKQFSRIYIEEKATTTHTVQYAVLAGPSYQISNQSQNPLSLLCQHLKDATHRVLISAESPGRREVLQELLRNAGCHVKPFDSWSDYLLSQELFGIVYGPLVHGALLTNPALEIITELQLFGQTVLHQRERRQKRGADIDTLVRDLTELQISAPIVHLDHGVGRYLGLTTITTNGITAEYLTLQYAEGAKIYVPVTSLQLVSRYTGLDPDNAPLDKLGSDKWQKAKRKALEQIHDVAAELLEIYAKREAEPGYTYTLPYPNYATFASHFEFDETPDQARSIEEVIADMTAPKKMDRLICGDVGFGKTEVAMRAAFIAAENGKQVAILVPTTLLASQHYQSFSDRFADFPIQIGLLSRLRTDKEQQHVLEGVEKGTVDIVIGTHRVIQKDVKFKDLGLVIIDEEHRFGVKQKETLKKLRAHMDILTLTATPIPRTLNLSLTGVRDISIISTPPLKRLAVKTFCYERSPAIIREAILREILRGGQVFFLHNRVETIERVFQELSELVPEAKIRYAHGQMHEREMERVMRDFYHHRFQVLICTTIVENGIDIPTANTIIIDRADHFGLAQLHQLRGRVGRSHHQAYAYLMIPGKKLISRDAEQRLDAFLAITELGAGFNLAMHDLEIRGSGEILGEEQSGNMEAIGYTLYMEILERTVKALKSGKTAELSKPLETGPEINLHISALIPESYMPDVHVRLIEYKRIANAESAEALRDLQVGLIDRFGLLPQQTKNLFRISELSLTARHLGVKKIDGNNGGLRFEFESDTKIDPKIILKLIQTQAKLYKFDSQQRLHYLQKSEQADDRMNMVHTVLSALGSKI